ncbi:MAG TPA: Ig-like domain-containing protein, partial [Mycobacterium sp.]|nr:Ig-like domain-containing protein [Mycobacterium sp.]
MLSAVLIASLTVVGCIQPALAAAPSAAPELTAPIDGYHADDANPVLMWQPVSGAAKYRVQVSTDLGFSSTVYDQVTVSNAATPPTDLPDGTLYWRVAGEDSSGNLGPESDVRSFDKAALAPPHLNGPNGESLSYPADPPVLSWDPVRAAKSYTVQIDDAADFIGAASYTTPNTSYTLTTPQTPGQQYYWHVSANFANNVSTGYNLDPQTYSVSWDSAPTLVSPANTLNPPISDVVFSWNPVPGAATYNLQVSPNGDFANFLSVNQTGIKGTRFSPANTLGNGSYFWRVQAVDAAGDKGSWSGNDSSDSWQFARGWVDALHNLERPTLQSPAWSAGNPGQIPHVDGSLQLGWSPIHHASRYEIEISTDPNFSPNPSITEQCYTNHTSFAPYKRELPSSEGSCNISGLSTGVVYYWHVRGIDDPVGVNGVWSNAGTSDTFRFIVDPTMPADIAPADGASVSTPALSWQPVLGAEKYKVTIKKANGSNVSGAPFTTYATSYTPTTALTAADGPFSWYVQSVDGNGDTSAIPASITWRTFTLVSPTPGALALTAPANGSSSVRMPAMSWVPVAGATKYEVHVSANGFESALTTTQPYASFTSTALPLPADTYSWSVVARNDGGILDQSGDRTFVINQPAVLGSADYGAPCNSHSTCTVNDTPTLTWTGVPNAGWYIVTVAIDSHFTNVIRQWGTAYTSLTPRESLLDNQAGQSFYWFVRPCVDATETRCGPAAQDDNANPNAASFHKSSAAVSLTSPDGSNPVKDQVVLSWQDYRDTNGDTADQEAKQYTVQVSATSDFATLLDSATVDQTTYTAYTKTYPEGPIYWRVQAIDGSGNPLTWSAPGTLIKQSDKVVLTAPAADETVTGVPAFQWHPQNYAASYSVEVYKNGDTTFSSGNKVLSATTKYAAWAPTSSLAGGDYAWRVRRVDAGGNAGPWSDGRTFSLDAGAPTLTAPSDGYNANSHDLLFTWTPVQGAVQYRWQLSASDFGTVEASTSTVMPAWSPTSALSDGMHYWRVQVLDAGNNVIATSGTRMFTMDGRTPTVTSHGPTSNASLTGAFSVTFSEPVQHVSAATFNVTVAGETTTIAGRVIASQTSASFDPSAPLVPGQSYTVSLTSGITDVVGNPLVPYSWTVRANTTVENTSPAVREMWDRDASSHASGGMYDSSKTTGSAATFTFTGTNVTVLGVRNSTGGRADIYLDGVKKASNVSFYSAAAQWQRAVWSVAGLNNANHTVQVRVLGTHSAASSGSWVRIDAFKVGATLYQEGNAAVQEAFRRVKTSSASDGSFDTAIHVRSGDNGSAPSYNMMFVGTGLTVYGVLSPASGRAAVYIDGVLRQTVGLHFPSTLYRYPIFTSSSLSSQQHTLRIDLIGT